MNGGPQAHITFALSRGGYGTWQAQYSLCTAGDLKPSQFTRCFYLIISWSSIETSLSELESHRLTPVSGPAQSCWGTQLLLCSSHNKKERSSWHVLSCITVPAQGSLGATDTVANDSWQDSKASVWSLQVPKVHTSVMQFSTCTHKHAQTFASQLITVQNWREGLIVFTSLR